MINLCFNKKNTKALISSIKSDKPLNKATLDWNLKNSHKIFGSIKKRLIKGDLYFIIMENNNSYNLACFGKHQSYNYLIEDIDAFLSNIYIEQLEILEGTSQKDRDNLFNLLNIVKELPYTGIIRIQDNKIYLYDSRDIIYK